VSENREINDVTPTSLSHIVGQRSVVEQVKVAVEAAFADGKKFDHALLVGGPGLGKTQLASVIAQEMAVEFNEALGQSIKTPGDLNALLLAAKHKSILHIDEVFPHLSGTHSATSHQFLTDNGNDLVALVRLLHLLCKNGPTTTV
jgi:Holliday junction DNA helicase RuvB